MSKPVKYQASAVLESHPLVLVRFEASQDGAPALTSIADRMAEEQLSSEFVSLGLTTSRMATLSLAIHAERMADFQRFCPQLEAELSQGKITVGPEVAMIGVYGPHFREKPGILDAFLGTLARVGVPIYAGASSISSLCALIPLEELPRARAALQQRFQLPG